MFDIRTLAAGEKISDPGFYNIPLSQHHNQPCAGVSVTSGILRTMHEKTPADVWAFHVLNPNRWVRKETDALRLGVAMALLVEGGPEKVLTAFSIHPDDKPRRPTPAQRKACSEGRGTDAAVQSVEYWDAVDTNPDDYLTQEEFETILTMGEVLMQDEAAKSILGGLPEVTMAWQDERTGLWVLSRPDTIHPEGIVTDYKKIATQGKPFNGYLVDQRIRAHRYDMQIALGAEGMERLLGEWPSAAGIIAQCGEAPHHVIIRSMSEEVLRMGQFHNRRALDRFAECLKSNHWPGPGEHVGSFHWDDATWARMIEEMNTQGVAP
ncbi:MAG: hypothetical protein JWQ44_2939 [Chthoniobacter sp.]|nr:hypothetical protein [Chthoniobacter sp.]